MQLDYTIEDCEGLEIRVLFEFHKELDGMLVFDGAWTVFGVMEGDGIFGIVPHDIEQIIHRWLTKGGEDKIYSQAEKELR